MPSSKSEINYEVGKDYPFTVVSIHDNFCELEDNSHFRVYLQNTNKLMLVRGQIITCKVLDNSEKRPKIVIVEKDKASKQKSLDINELDDVLKEMVTTWDKSGFSKLLLMKEKDNLFEDECRQWIGTLASMGCDLQNVRTDCTQFLERSDFLSLCNPAEREFYQYRLTTLIELLGYYIKANQLLEEGKENDFIDILFEKLKASGYVYHPVKNFNIMSCLFLADKQLMEVRMEKLFDVIREWDVEIWGKEPFNSTLTKIIELYVSENIWTLDRIKNNNAQVINLVQALTIQLMLLKTANRENEPEYKLSLTRLCVISTYLYELSPKRLLDLGLSNLLNDTCQLPLYTLDDTKSKTVPFRLSGMIPKSIMTTSSFVHEKGKLRVSEDGITLFVGKEDGSKANNCKRLGLWKQLQVFAGKNSVKALPDKVGITDCIRFWEDTERALFPVAEKSVTNQKKSHKIDDKVEIVITRQDRNDKNLFHCRINDKIGGEGTIRIKDIVPYAVESDIQLFRSETGKELVFEAVIIDKEDDSFIFSMSELVKQWANTLFAEDEEIVCFMQNDRPVNGNGRIPGITMEGISVSIGGFDEIIETQFKRGDIITASMQSEGPGTFHIKAKVKKHCPNTEFTITSAFHELMLNYAFADEETEEDKEMQRSDRFLDDAFVKEIVRMIDRMSTIDSEYVNAYYYLGFARVLCMMIGWEEQASYYKGRMELIKMLHNFAINDVVNQVELENMERINADIFRNDASLFSKFLQLQTVSFLGRSEHDNDLWEIYNKQDGVVKDVASLVIAYNMVKRNNMERLCVDLQNRIKQTLRLKGYESNLKIYGNGTEDQKTEYKTSIVFPPNENMKANMPKQMKNIMKVIASFLNTQGGTLYVGVNDYGVGVGVENDLAYSYFMDDKDKYQRTIMDEVVKTWGNLVATFVNVAFDHTNEQKDVLVITVQPYSEGVSYGKKWLVRIGSTKRELTQAEFEQYKKTSRTTMPPIEPSATTEPTTTQPLAKSTDATPSQTDVSSSQAAGVTSSNAATSSTTSTPQEKEKKPSAKNTKAAAPVEETIQTSKVRRNTLEEYEDDYRPHIACLKFLKNGKFCKVTNYDYDPGILALAVYEEEENAYLIMGYDDGTVSKVPVDNLLKFEDYQEYTLNNRAKLVFATIAQEKDAIVTISRENKTRGRQMVRIDLLSELEEGMLASSGERFFKEGIGSVVAYEVAPHEQLKSVEVLINQDERTLGFPISTLSEKVKTQLADWGITT